MAFKYYTNPVTGDCTWTGEEVPENTIIYYNGQYWIATDNDCWQGLPSVEYPGWMPLGNDVTDFEKYASLSALRSQIPPASDSGKLIHIYKTSGDSAINAYLLQGKNIRGYHTLLYVGLVVKAGSVFKSGETYTYNFTNLPVPAGAKNILGNRTGIDMVTLASLENSDSITPSINFLAYADIHFTGTEATASLTPIGTDFTVKEASGYSSFGIITLYGGALMFS